MRILFIHSNFPAQFGQLGDWLANKGWDVTFATARKDIPKGGRIRIVQFESHRHVTDGIHNYVAGLEKAVIAGQGFVRTAVQLRNEGYAPDIIVAHSGWGVGMFAKDVWPDAKFVPYFEWYYRSPAIDRTPHDPAKRDPLDQSAFTRVRNTPFYLDFSAADAALAPTKFQASQFPEELRKRLTVMHDGIDTRLHQPAERDTALMEELGIPDDAEIISWVTRGMEPARGFPEMMKAVAELQKARPKLHIIIVGEDRVAYGSKVAVASWKDKMLAELDLDETRMHFTGLVPRPKMIRILQTGDLHLYLTAPFVLSWSMLDAMACGCQMVASDVEPVREFLKDGTTGRLADTYDHDALVGQVTAALDDPKTAKTLRTKARKLIVDKYDAQTKIFPAKMKFFEGLV